MVDGVVGVGMGGLVVVVFEEVGGMVGCEGAEVRLDGLLLVGGGGVLRSSFVLLVGC